MGSNNFWMSAICSSILVFYIIIKFIYCEKANLPPGFYITLVMLKLSKRFRQIYVAFSKNLNLNEYMFQIPNYTYLIKFEKCSSWYFVTKIVQRKTFLIRGWRPRICKIFEITRTIYSNSERLEQFLVTECFFNLFLEVSQIW